jgi:sorting nexin-29
MYIKSYVLGKTLERVVRDAGINTRGTIFYKSVQILAFADDMDIFGRTQKSMKEAFLSLEEAANKMNLQINRNKTKYPESLATDPEVPGSIPGATRFSEK